MPDCVGVGVWTPFPVLVVVVEVAGGVVVVGLPPVGGSPQFCSMQYELPTMSEQAPAWEGF
jgi:hypothetical protein